jgi:hypothetical protein
MGARQLAPGYAAIKKAVGRMTVLAEWMEKFKPACTVLTLWPRDFEAICSNPETAARFQITVRGTGPPVWREFTLTARARGDGSK